MDRSVAIRGELGRQVRITIHDYERREATDTSDANWLRCSIEAEIGNFRAATSASLETHNFFRFVSDLDAILATEANTASFASTEGWLTMDVEVDRRGHARIAGALRDIDSMTSLTFRFESDLTFLRATREELREVVSAFPVRDG